MNAYATLEGYDAEYILEEILCDYEAGMNIFSEEDVSSLFWEMAQEVLQSDAVKADSARGPPADGRTSREYWRPNLKKAEWDLLNYSMERAGTELDEATYWLFVNQKGHQVFCIYGIGDGTENTPLYASGGKTAVADAARFNRFLEGYGHEYVKEGKTFDRWIKDLRSEERNSRSHLYDTADRRTDVGNVLVSGGSQRSVVRGTLERSTKNSSQKVKFSREFIQAQMTEKEMLLEKTNRMLERENGKLREDNQYLKELVKIQKSLTGGAKFTRTSVEVAAKRLMAEASAKGDTKACMLAG